VIWKHGGLLRGVLLSVVLPVSMQGVIHVLRVLKSGRFATTNADLYPASTIYCSSIERIQRAHTDCPLTPSAILHRPRHIPVPSPSCSSQTMKSSRHIYLTYLHDVNLREAPSAYSPITLSTSFRSPSYPSTNGPASKGCRLRQPESGWHGVSCRWSQHTYCCFEGGREHRWWGCKGEKWIGRSEARVWCHTGVLIDCDMGSLAT
jgi:hypothetical protein